MKSLLDQLLVSLLRLALNLVVLRMPQRGFLHHSVLLIVPQEHLYVFMTVLYLGFGEPVNRNQHTV